MDNEVPTLEVGFAINLHDSFGQLRSLDDLLGETAAKAVRDFAKVEAASRGAVDMKNAAAQMTTFGNAATREMQSVARETNRAEKAAEGMIRQIERQVEVFGKSSSEIRRMRAEMRALEAEQRGLTDVATRLRAASAEIDRLESGVGRVGKTAGRNGYALTQFGMQLNDIGTMAALGAPPMQIFASQAGQIVQIVQGAEGGLGGFARALGAAAVAAWPLVLAVTAVVGGFALFSRSVSKGIDTQKMIDGLGLTREEMKKLKNTSVTTGDVIKATFQELAVSVGLDLSNMSKWFGEAMDWMTTIGRKYLAALYSSFVGTFTAISTIVKGVFAGKGIAEIMKDIADNYKGAFKEADAWMVKFGGRVNKRIAANKLADLTEQAEAIKKERDAKSNTQADSLMREAQAIEAQIRNLYNLADAYATSGAAALVAEARVKAETAAIKKRADIEEAVSRQVRLAIAQRVADAAKTSASAREQVAALRDVNAMVAAGLVPAQRANELVQERIADLPLLAAIEVAQQRGLKVEAEKATRALEGQRKVREQMRAETVAAQFNTDMAGGSNRIAMLQTELDLVGATDDARIRALTTLQAEQEAKAKQYDPAQAQAYIAQQVEIALAQKALADAQRNYNEALSFTADKWDLIARNIDNAARGMADAFGRVGAAIGDMATIYASFQADRARLDAAHIEAIRLAGKDEAALGRANAKYALATATRQVGLYGDMAAAAKGFFKEGSDGYKALETAEKAFRAVEFALSVRAMIQDVRETAAAIINSGARTAAKAVEAVVSAISSLPFPLNLAAGAATIAALASIGVAVAGSFGGGGNSRPKSNTGTGTVLGDSSAKSESIKRSIDALKEVDVLMLGYSREMAASLRSIESQIGGFAGLLVREGNINASEGLKLGFDRNFTGDVLKNIITGGGLLSKIPIVGDILGAVGNFIGSLFGTKKKIVGTGIFGDDQSLQDIMSGGFDADYFTDIKKKKKFFGVTTSTSYSTKYADASPELEQQFTLILSQFNNAIKAAAGPLGVSTDEIQNKLNNFVVKIGKINLKGLTGEEIEEKLTAVFGAVADDMARAAFPGFERFQQVGEGLFETLVRVASTVETVTSSLQLLGKATTGLSIDAQVSLAEQFDSIGAMTSAVQGYFEAYYTKSEQASARTAQFAKVFDSLDLAMPSTLASFRALVEAQDLTTEAGRATYATLLQLAPAFADLQQSLNGAKSAADILSERQDLQRRMLELQGNTAALRAMDLANIDASNRLLQEQIWALEDAQAAAAAAKELRDAWISVGDTIMDEVKRIRGLSDNGSSGGFASLLSQFNAATIAARGGDQEVAKTLPGLSQALLQAASLAATSKQELDRIRAQTAASLESTYDAIRNIADGGINQVSVAQVAAAGQATSSDATASNDNLMLEIKSLREEVTRLREDNNSGHAATAGNTAAVKRHLDNVTQASGGDAISTVQAA